MNPDQSDVKILVVDDQRSYRDLLIRLLEPQGYKILAAPNGEIALKIASRMKLDLILLDIVMPDMDGFSVCEKLKQNDATAQIPTIFTTIKDEPENIIRGFQVGGVDYIAKPFYEDEVIMRVKTHLTNSRLARELQENNRKLLETNRQLEKEIVERIAAEEARDESDEQLKLISAAEAAHWPIANFIGKSKAVDKILDSVRRLQKASTTTVLITGESGTGKELITRTIHLGSERAEKPFIPVNCSAIPSELAESLLFGHVRGAFTGAISSRKGYFEEASGGTLFLDEVGGMPLGLQDKLLRVLESNSVMPVGGVEEKTIDVRVIAATNSDLQTKIAKGEFRSALYYRLAHFTIEIPPLRERKEDIPQLATHFLSMFTMEMKREKIDLSDEALKTLMDYDFPGNVRELKNIIERALIECDNSTIMPEHLHLLDRYFHNISEQTRYSGVETLNNAATVAPMLIRPPKDEDIIYQYVQQHSSINNSECRQLLDCDINHANYLFSKLCDLGKLRRTGRQRSTRYILA